MHILHEKAKLLAKTYLQTESELISVLQEIDKRKIFRDLGYSSLFSYYEKALGLSENQSCNFIAVSRKCSEVPELKKAIDSGELSVSRAKRVVPVINILNSSDWIQKAQDLSQREVERMVAAQNPDKAIRSRVRPVSETKAELRCGISYELQDKLERVRAVLSQKKGRPCTLEEVIEAAADLYLEKNDPLQKAQRAGKRPSQEGNVTKMENPRVIPARIKHEVFLRDKGQCQHREPDGRPCMNNTFLHLHHIKPVSDGGQSILENLITLCSAHHKHVHSKAA
jgi:5-methylcytosine-specific restriction endonuclease McrA